MNLYKSRSFIIAVLGLLILAAMASRGVDTSASIVALCGAYIASKASLKASHVWAASKDSQADTESVINGLK